ncbi:hypothetical protein AVEN_249886-1, partial [Araneus ventricosus]
MRFLLSKMRICVSESESRPFSRLDADAIERLQDLSTQLAKQ